MKKSRWIAITAAGIVLAGLGLGTLAYLSSPGANAQASVLPEAATWMPASANFVAHLDLASIAASPIRKEWESSLQRQKALDEVEEFRAKTGLDPWNDFKTLSISTERIDQSQSWGLALIGNLDPKKIISAIEDKETIERESYEDTTLYVFSHTQGDRQEDHALAFPSDNTVLFGPPEYVRTMLDVGASRRPSAVEGALAGWAEELAFNDAFWCVGSAKEALGNIMARRSEGSPQVPPIESFAVSGKLDSNFSMLARGRAADADSAQKLADVVRGFVALGSLQQQAKPEIQAILDSVQIQVLENTVEVYMAVPYETLRRLAHHEKEKEGEPKN
jgi:hypothetical protein